MIGKFFKKLGLAILLGLSFTLLTNNAFAHSGLVVIETDFGSKDGAVNAVKGVMYSVDRSLILTDLTHEIPSYNIWEAAYRLHQTTPYWPKGTVFVSVIDPGVGTNRKSIVALSNSGQYFVTPDNGILTLIADTVGIKEIREIDETRNRLKGSSSSYTFHGRDVYGYTAARLASGKITFEEVGPVSKIPLTKIPYEKAFINDNKLQGTIAILDPQYGNLWTNIPSDLAQKYGMTKGQKFKVAIYNGNIKKYEGILPYQYTFGEVPKGSGLIYTNSLMNLSLGINQEDFSKKYAVTSGPTWRIEIQKIVN